MHSRSLTYLVSFTINIALRMCKRIQLCLYMYLPFVSLSLSLFSPTLFLSHFTTSIPLPLSLSLSTLHIYIANLFFHAVSFLFIFFYVRYKHVLCVSILYFPYMNVYILLFYILIFLPAYTCICITEKWNKRVYVYITLHLHVSCKQKDSCHLEQA